MPPILTLAVQTSSEHDPDVPEPERARLAMTTLREQIDAVDRSISELLAMRVRYAHEIGRAKRALGLPIYDSKREDAIVTNVRTHLEGRGLDAYEVAVLDIYRTLVLVCRHAQDDQALD